MAGIKLADEKERRIHNLLSDIRDFNEKARKSEDPEKAQESHKICSARVKELEKEGGTVGTAFRNLDYLGKGIIGDKICRLTKRHTELTLREEASKDIKDLKRIERSEEDIEIRAKRKREREKLSK
jgi:hypothetical protein